MIIIHTSSQLFRCSVRLSHIAGLVFHANRRENARGTKQVALHRRPIVCKMVGHSAR